MEKATKIIALFLAVVSENTYFNYKTFTKFSIHRSGCSACGNDENGNTASGGKVTIPITNETVFIKGA